MLFYPLAIIADLNVNLLMLYSINRYGNESCSCLISPSVSESSGRRCLREYTWVTQKDVVHQIFSDLASIFRSSHFSWCSALEPEHVVQIVYFDRVALLFIFDRVVLLFIFDRVAFSFGFDRICFGMKAFISNETWYSLVYI